VLLGALYRAGTARRGGGEEIWRLSVVEALKLQCASYGEREGYLGEEIVGGGGRRKTEAAWEMSRVSGGARHGSACLGSEALAS
jgi:hypothetical protein